MPLLETKGAASAQGFGGAGAGASGPVTYIEDVFSTWLYTGNSSTQTITNGIDLAGKGGLVWSKSRGSAISHALYDTVRGNVFLASDSTAGNTSPSISGVSFSSSGYNLLGADGNLNNTSFNPYVSWTFREQPKFFDVVTYTGTGAVQNIAHSLGSTPGCIIVKCTSNADNWGVWHRSLNNSTGYLLLNSTAASGTSTSLWGNTAPTSTTFTVGNNGITGASGFTYVAYLFAHDAGGFGLTGTDNVISCGSYTGNGSLTGPNVNLGYEPQWLLVKNATTAGPNWFLFDNMRGVVVGGNDARLVPNTSDAESSSLNLVEFNATGFQLTYNGNAINGSGDTYIYIAIRRGPMKVPTSGTSVFTPVAWTATDAPATVSGFNFPVDLTWHGQRAGVYGSSNVTSWDRLRGAKAELYTGLTDAEGTRNGVTGFDYMSAVQVSNPTTVGEVNYPASNTEIFWGFRRAPGFFDVVCYTGDNQNPTRSIPHNLAAVPELIIHKYRNVSGVNWNVYLQSLGTNAGLILNGSNATITPRNLFGTPSASDFVVKQTSGDTSGMNWTGTTYVAYLFATCAGVSKVGSYTGTGALQTIDCGFTGGARFVLIKRTDSTGDWYVYDSARGIVAGSDPYLTLNTTAAEVTTTDWVDTYSAGFELSNAGGNNVNINGATYIFLSVA